MEKRVLLIDCDLRRPNVHNIFKLDNKKGLTNVIGKMIEIDDLSSYADYITYSLDNDFEE